MEGQDMAGYKPPGWPAPPQAAAHEPEKSHKKQSNHSHTHQHHAHGHDNNKRKEAKNLHQLTNALARSSLRDDDSKNKNGNKVTKKTHHKRNRGSGGKALNQLVNALARSNLEDNDKNEDEKGKKLTKSQRNRQKSRITLRELQALVATRSERENGQSTAREARSRSGMLPLPFDGVYLRKVRGLPTSMTNDQIRDWLKSVFKPHIKDWYHECLSLPENQAHIEAAQAAPYLFSKAVVKEAMDQHGSSDLLGSLLEETDACPTAFHSEKKRNNSLTFIQHSAMVACLVVRDGRLSGPILAHERKCHQAAAALLASVIMDLKTDLGYFLRLLLDVEGKEVPTGGDGQALVVAASGKEEQKDESQASFKGESRVVQMSSELFGSLARDLLRLQHDSDCEISFDRPDIFREKYLVTLTGAADEVREAEQIVKTLMESSNVPVEADLMVLSVQAGDMSIE